MWYIFHGKIPKNFQYNKTGSPNKRYIHHTYILLYFQTAVILVVKSMPISKLLEMALRKTKCFWKQFLANDKLPGLLGFQLTVLKILPCNFNIIVPSKKSK